MLTYVGLIYKSFGLARLLSYILVQKYFSNRPNNIAIAEGVFENRAIGQLYISSEIFFE